MKKKIFTIDYLINEPLTDEDLHYLLDTNSLKLSLIVGEFREINSELTDKEIIKLCSNDEQWMYKQYWTLKQLNEFEKKIAKIYKNIYQYSNERCNKLASWFISIYGLTNVKNKDKNLETLND